MNQFRETLDGFRNELNRESARSASPEFQAILARERHNYGMRLRWAMAALAIVSLAAIPGYMLEWQKRRAAAQARADAVLMEQVNAGLTRSVPRAMAPLNGFVFEPVNAKNVCREGLRQC